MDLARGAKWALGSAGGPLKALFAPDGVGEWGAMHHRHVRERLGRSASWAILGEDLPELDNRVELSPTVTDSFGLPAARVHYRISENSRRLMAFQADRARESLEAAGAWRSALQLAPGNARLERELLTTLYLGRDYEHALPMLEHAQKQEPKSAELNFFTGDSYLHLEQVEKALPYLETAVRVDPKLLPARASLGLAYARMGKPAEAIPNLLAALEIDDDGSLHYQLSRAYQATGEAEKAKEFLKKYQDIQQRAAEQKKDLEEKVQITAP